MKLLLCAMALVAWTDLGLISLRRVSLPVDTVLTCGDLRLRVARHTDSTTIYRVAVRK